MKRYGVKAATASSLSRNETKKNKKNTNKKIRRAGKNKEQKMIRPTDQRLAELREEYKKYVANHHHQWQMVFDFGAGEPSQLQDFWSWTEYKAW